MSDAVESAIRKLPWYLNFGHINQRYPSEAMNNGGTNQTVQILKLIRAILFNFFGASYCSGLQIALGTRNSILFPMLVSELFHCCSYV